MMVKTTAVLWLTAVPAAAATLAICAVALLPRLGPGRTPDPGRLVCAAAGATPGTR
jgi:hypothetical protein